MSRLAVLDPLSGDMDPRRGFLTVTAFCLVFWALLYAVPALLVPPWADADSATAVVEVYRRQWLVHGHPLRSSWLFGGGTLFRGLAQIPGWSPVVLLAFPLGAKLATVAWSWLQLGLGGGFAYGWARTEGASHRGAALVAVLGWCSLWQVRHLVDGHLAWPSLAWVLGLGWLASAELSVRRRTLLGLGLALLLSSSSPLQAPFYGLPLLLLALTRRGGPQLLVGLVLAASLHLPLVLDTFEAHQLYARDTTIELQDIKFLQGGSRVLRNLLGLVVPFASYGYHAEGNLLALLPLLWAAGRPSRRLLAVAAVLVLVGLLPGMGGVRQLERWWWALVLGATWHLALNEQRLSTRLVQLSLGFTAALSAAIVALRALVSVAELPPPEPGLNGIARVQESYLANDEVEGGVYGAVRSGRVVHRPFTHVSLDEVAPARAFVLQGPAPSSLEEGLLVLPLRAGEEAVLALRPESVQWMEVSEGVTLGSRGGWVTVTADRDVTATVRAR